MSLSLSLLILHAIARVQALTLRLWPSKFSTEYVALVGSFILIGLEALIRIITLALRERRQSILQNHGEANLHTSATNHSLLLLSVKKSLQFPIFASRKEVADEKEK